MKRLLFTALICAAATGVFAQETTKDSVNTSNKKKGVKITLGYGDDAAGININSYDSIKTVSKAPGFSFGLTFSRFDIGLATLVDNGSFDLSPNNQFLRYRSWKSSNVGFDVVQFGYRFNSAFRIYVSGGFDWTHIRLRENITIQKGGDNQQLRYTQDNIDYDKNRFSSSYLRIPLSFDWRSHVDNDGKRFHIVAGPDIGLLLNGRVKQKSEENGKQKFNDDYHFTKMRYGAFARVGYGGTGLFAKYYFNDMFTTDQQKGLKNFSFGLMFGF
jgi:hypothetical protein